MTPRKSHDDKQASTAQGPVHQAATGAIWVAEGAHTSVLRNQQPGAEPADGAVANPKPRPNVDPTDPRYIDPKDSLTGTALVTRGSFTLDVALHLQATSRIGIIGPNGAGKSTLVSAIAGVLPLDRESTLRFGGETLPPPERRQIGYMMQDGLLFPHLNVRDNVAFGPRRAGLSKRDAHAAATDALELVGVPHLASRGVSGLSGGERQRVALARALASEPRFLLLDEPFAGLDVDAAASMRTLIRKIADERKLAVLLISHDLVDVVALCDHVLVLESGRVGEALRVTELQSRPVTPFAAAFAGLSRIPGVVDLREFIADSGVRFSLKNCSVEAEQGERAFLLTRPHHVRVRPVVEMQSELGLDRAQSLVGSGTSIVTRLESGLTTAEIIPAGTAVSVELVSGCVLPERAEAHAG